MRKTPLHAWIEERVGCPSDLSDSEYWTATWTGKAYPGVRKF
jgi:hypothetical protein